MFGAASDNANEVGMFESRLNEFKTLLVKLYRQKTKLIAEREAARFQYVTGIRTKLGNLIGAMLSQSYVDGNMTAQGLLDNFTRGVLQQLPMTTVGGAPVDGYSRNPQMLYNRRIGYLSPIAMILSEPYHQDASNPDQRPLYKIIVTDSAMYGRMNVATVLESDYLALFKQLYSNSGTPIPFTLPPSKEWLYSYFPRVGSSTDYIEQSYDYFAEMLNRDFPQYGGSFIKAMQLAEELMRQVIDKTRLIIELQLQIDKIEEELNIFVAEFSSYAASIGLNISDILRDIQAAADAADVVSTVEELPPVPQKKSKWPWLIAAAGLYVLTKDKQ